MIATGSVRGQVDVALTVDKQRIACEIAISSSADYEVGNIEKCLRGEYEQVLVVVQNPDHRVAIMEQATAALTEAALDRNHFVHFDDIKVVLNQMAQLRDPTTLRG